MRGRVAGFLVGLVVGVAVAVPVASPAQFSAPIMEALRTLGWVSSDSVHTRWSKSFLWSGGSYLNFGSVYGSTGYGIRDNAGVLQVKSSGGAWANVVSGVGDSGTTCTQFVNGVCTVASDANLLALVHDLRARVDALEAPRAR